MAKSFPFIGGVTQLEGGNWRIKSSPGSKRNSRDAPSLERGRYREGTVPERTKEVKGFWGCTGRKSRGVGSDSGAPEGPIGLQKEETTRRVPTESGRRRRDSD